MPEQEGIKTIIQIKRERPGVKVIAMSGGGGWITDLSLLHTAKLLGADHVIRKPLGRKDS